VLQCGLNIGTSLRDGLKNACEKLTQKQRRIIVGTMLIVFAVLVAVSFADIFRNGTKLTKPGHISPLKMLETTKNDTVSLKTIDNGTE
jgi:hypothetical protein